MLAQDTKTGVLSFQPVLATHRNGPSKTLRIAIGNESIVATGIHRFWIAGKGWTMVRDLKAGDSLRMIGGTTTVESVEPDGTQLVYNLTVAADGDFLVGARDFWCTTMVSCCRLQCLLTEGARSFGRPRDRFCVACEATLPFRIDFRRIRQVEQHWRDQPGIGQTSGVCY